MSWSISHLGHRAAVKAAVNAVTPPTADPERAQFDNARTVILAAVDAFTGANGVQVEASGTVTEQGGRVVILVEAKRLELDPPAPAPVAAAEAPTSPATPAAVHQTAAAVASK